MPAITTNVEFSHIAREWRCKWSIDSDKKSLSELQDLLTTHLSTIKNTPGVVSVQRVVCGGCLDFKVVIKLDAAAYGDFEKSGHGVEAAFLDAMKSITGVSFVETQTYTLETL